MVALYLYPLHTTFYICNLLLLSSVGAMGCSIMAVIEFSDKAKAKKITLGSHTEHRKRDDKVNSDLNWDKKERKGRIRKEDTISSLRKSSTWILNACWNLEAWSVVERRPGSPSLLLLGTVASVDSEIIKIFCARTIFTSKYVCVYYMP
jgi:hypothetical protein